MKNKKVTKVFSSQRMMQLAQEKNHKVLRQGWTKSDGRRFFVVDSYSCPGGTHVVRHTAHGFECDEQCESFKNRGGCAHIGTVSLLMNTLSQEARLAILRPRPIVLRQAVEVVRVAELQHEAEQVVENWQDQVMARYGRK